MLKDLDLEKIMTAQAKNLSGGQKRKLSVGIAILGDPKVPGVWIIIIIISFTPQFLHITLSQRSHVGLGLFSFRSCCWMSPQQAWTPAPDIRCGLC